MFVVQKALGHGSGAATDVFIAKGRISDDQIKLSARGRELRDRRENILEPELKLSRSNPGRGEVLLDEPRMFPRKLDTGRIRRAATEAFEAESAGTAEEFQHACIEDASAEAVKDRLPDQIGRGPDPKSLGRFQNESRSGAANDAHGR